MKQEDEVMKRLKLAGIPITRENYIHYLYPSSYGVSGLWCAELEATLPEELQDPNKMNLK
jgi:hypothetical protein